MRKGIAWATVCLLFTLGVVACGSGGSGNTGGSGYSITGRVAESSSTGIAGVSMSITGLSSVTVSTDSSGNYGFSDISSGTYTLTPSKTGYTFTPMSKAITLNNANVIGQDFVGKNSTDTIAPSVPSNLITTATSSNQINLSWTASTDAIGVTGYKIYRGGAYLKSSVTISALDSPGLNASTQYCYQVSAYDAAGNESSKCSEVCATTLAPPTAKNQSVTTVCAEDDNINIPFRGRVTSFSIQATHPTYSIMTDNCNADFVNCTSSGTSYPFAAATYKLYDDHETVVEAVRQSSWWRPTGMTFSVDNGTQYSNIHYVTVSKKVTDENSWPQYLVLYMDGNLRLIPQPPAGASSVCFGSSVIIGPAVEDTRPIAEIVSAHFVSASKTVDITYKSGGSSVLSIGEVDRTHARVGVSVSYPTDTNPFAIFRSMYVIDGNADVDHVQWINHTNSYHDDSIMSFVTGESSNWLFHRLKRSQHNTSAPDITITAD